MNKATEKELDKVIENFGVSIDPQGWEDGDIKPIKAFIDEHFVEREDQKIRDESFKALNEFSNSLQPTLYTKEQVEEIIGEDIPIRDCNLRGYDEVCDKCHHLMTCEYADQDRRVNQAKEEARKRL
jgi:hypothetical protein